MFEPFVSYAAISNFDTDKFLYTTATKYLTEQYIKAREVNQRVNLDIAKLDRRVIESVNEVVTDISAFFYSTLDQLEDVTDYLDAFMEDVNLRAFFHLDRGLQNVKYILEHDFVRGWEIVEERTLRYVAENFYGVIESSHRLIQDVNSTFGMDQLAQRVAVWMILKNGLSGRRQMAERAIDNITEVHNSYKIGRPLLLFKLTYQRQYDKSYIAVDLLQAESKRQDEYFNGMIQHLHDFIEAIDDLIIIGEEFVHNGNLNHTWLHVAEDKFITAAERYYYRMFQFKTRIVNRPVELIDEIIEEFHRLNRSLHNSYEEVKLRLSQFRESLLEIRVGTWSSVSKAASLAVEFVEDNKIRKTRLAEAVTTSVMAKSVVALEIFFSDLRSRSTNLMQSWIGLATDYNSIWRAMLEEASTQNFYAKVHEDFLMYESHISNRSELYNHLLKTFAYMLHIKRAKFPSLDLQDIERRTNADFSTTNTTNKMLAIDEAFHNMSMQTDITTTLKDTDETFFKLFARLTRSLETYLDENRIDSQFVR